MCLCVAEAVFLQAGRAGKNPQWQIINQYAFAVKAVCAQTFEPVTFIIHNVPFLTIFGLAVTLTFDLLISKCNQFIFVPECT